MTKALNDYLKLYDLESYLFDIVRPKFQEDGSLSAFDFFCIVIWKANRAKSYVARRLMGKDKESRKRLDPIVHDLTSSLFRAAGNKERLGIMVQEWGLGLPIASAILTILWPDDFTVYDVRVCDAIGGFRNLQNKSRFDEMWQGYCKFKEAVTAAAPKDLCLRDKDRYLWAGSFDRQLRRDIESLFAKKK